MSLGGVAAESALQRARLALGGAVLKGRFRVPRIPRGAGSTLAADLRGPKVGARGRERVRPRPRSVAVHFRHAGFSLSARICGTSRVFHRGL